MSMSRERKRLMVDDPLHQGIVRAGILELLKRKKMPMYQQMAAIELYQRFTTKK